MNEHMLERFSMRMFSLDGKVAVVTGGNKGIGQAIVVGFAKAGADIFVPAHSETNWEEIERLVKKAGKKVVFLKVDLSKREDIERAIDVCIEEFGRIDILVNNAGTIRRAPALEHSDKYWQTVMKVNLDAVFYMTRDIAKVMAQQGGGKIINIASVLSFQGGKFVVPYTTSKHGVVGLTRAFANELAALNIQVNAIAPGYIRTGLTSALRSDESRNAEIVSRIPAGRWGEPSDLVGAAVFLASRASDYVNGHTLVVDGGWLVR